MEKIMMNGKKQNKIFFTILSLLIIASVGVTFYKIVINKNYQIAGETSCNPVTEKCFVRECDSSSGEKCIESLMYYKKISKKNILNNIPQWSFLLYSNKYYILNY